MYIRLIFLIDSIELIALILYVAKVYIFQHKNNSNHKIILMLLI